MGEVVLILPDEIEEVVDYRQLFPFKFIFKSFNFFFFIPILVRKAVYETGEFFVLAEDVL